MPIRLSPKLAKAHRLTYRGGGCNLILRLQTECSKRHLTHEMAWAVNPRIQAALRVMMDSLNLRSTEKTQICLSRLGGYRSDAHLWPTSHTVWNGGELKLNSYPCLGIFPVLLHWV